MVKITLALLLLLPCIYGGCKSVNPKDKEPRHYSIYPPPPPDYRWLHENDVPVGTMSGRDTDREQDVHKLAPARLNDSLSPEARPFFDYYRSLSPCRKVAYIDSTFYAQTIEGISGYSFLYTSTLTNNFYYYIIYDIMLMTEIRTSSFTYDYFHMLNTATIRTPLITRYSDTLDLQYDIERWKKKLGCPN